MSVLLTCILSPTSAMKLREGSLYNDKAFF